MAKEKKELSKAWQDTIDRLNKSYGKGSVIKLGEKLSGNYDVIPTGSIAFDLALGVGGFARGKIIELMGWEGTGKTTICGHACANAQEKFPDKKIVYIDGEHALDRNYFEKLGVNVNEMFISQPRSGEEGLQIASDLIDTGDVSLVIIDSDTSLKPLSEVEGEMTDSSIGKKARLNSKAYPIIHNKAAIHNTLVIVISQFREKIGVMFGSPITTSGGNALRFYADVRIEVSKIVLKEGEQQVANKTKIKITKNKVGNPYRACEFNIIYGIGIDKIGEIIELGSEEELVFKKYGKTITYDGIKYEMEAFRELLESNEAFRLEVENKIKTKFQPKIEEENLATTLEVIDINEVKTDLIEKQTKFLQENSSNDGPIGISFGD